MCLMGVILQGVVLGSRRSGDTVKCARVQILTCTLYLVRIWLFLGARPLPKTL